MAIVRTPEKFGNCVFTTYPMFSVHTLQEKFETATIPKVSVRHAGNRDRRNQTNIQSKTMNTTTRFPAGMSREQNWHYTVILDLCSRKTRTGKSHDYRNVIVFEKLRYQRVFRPLKKRKASVFKFIW